MPAAGEAAAVWVDPRTLKPWAGNPRKNDGASVDRAVKSIERFGFGAPIVAREADREIIAGHTRWKAAIQMGLDLVPVRFLDVSAADAHKLAIADNRHTELTPWDDPLLAEQLVEMEPIDQLLGGFAPDEVGDLVADLSAVEVTPDTEPPAPSKRKRRCPQCQHEW
jgi:ParB-like chromosome segregation protein Spo0J